MARKQERKYKSFNLEDSPVVEENERLLNDATTPQQAQTTVALLAEATERIETAGPAQAVAPIVQPQSQVQQPQSQFQQQPIAQTAQSIGMQSVGNRSKKTGQGITVMVPMEYYEQIALMKMRTGIPIRDIALQAVIEFVDKHQND